MYIVDDPFTVLAFVYLCACGTNVCGMLIAILRRDLHGTTARFLYRHHTFRPRLRFHSAKLPDAAGRCHSFAAVEYKARGPFAINKLCTCRVRASPSHLPRNGYLLFEKPIP